MTNLGKKWYSLEAIVEGEPEDLAGTGQDGPQIRRFHVFLGGGALLKRHLEVFGIYFTPSLLL